MSWTPEIVFHGSPRAPILIVLAHGAGAGMDSPFMEHVSSGLAERGLRVARFEFPYMQRSRQTGKRRPPDRAPVLLETWQAVIKKLRQRSDAFFDVHLMVSDPLAYVGPMADAGADGFTFHVEAAADPCDVVDAVRAASRPMVVGVALRPDTPVEALDALWRDGAFLPDLVLVMTVPPGFGGQAFMADQMPKVEALRRRFPTMDIQVDGGLNLATVEVAARAGANCIVAGSAVFKSDRPAEVISALRDGVETLALHKPARKRGGMVSSWRPRAESFEHPP